MSELDCLIKTFEKEIYCLEKYDCYFPNTDDYCKYVLDWIKAHSRKNWCKKSGNGLYDIIQQKEKLFGNYQDATLQENGIYLIESDERKMVYVGKGETGNRIFNRILDHVMPPHPDHPYKNCETYINSQQMQNTPEIWVDHLANGRKIRIVLYLGITLYKNQTVKNLSPIESRIYNDCLSMFGHKPFYNKTTPY